jgi:hypothetical protein
MYSNFPLCFPICVTKYPHCNKWATGCELENSVNHDFITPCTYDEFYNVTLACRNGLEFVRSGVEPSTALELISAGQTEIKYP